MNKEPTEAQRQELSKDLADRLSGITKVAKSGESSLLTDEEISEQWHYFMGSESNDGSWHYLLKVLKGLRDRQDVQTASIKDAEWVKYLEERQREWQIGKDRDLEQVRVECQVRIEALIEAIARRFEIPMEKLEEYSHTSTGDEVARNTAADPKPGGK